MLLSGNIRSNIKQKQNENWTFFYYFCSQNHLISMTSLQRGTQFLTIRKYTHVQAHLSSHPHSDPSSLLIIGLPLYVARETATNISGQVHCGCSFRRLAQAEDKRSTEAHTRTNRVCGQMLNHCRLS